MRRANPFPALVVQAIVALALGAAATMLVQIAGRTMTTFVMGLLLVLFFYALLTAVPAVLASRWRWGRGPGFGWLRRHGGGGSGTEGGRGGGWGGVREPRRPRWPGFPPRAAEVEEPQGAERTV